MLRYEHSEGVLTIFLTGDIDAQNAAELQREIMRIVKSRMSRCPVPMPVCCLC